MFNCWFLRIYFFLSSDIVSEQVQNADLCVHICFNFLYREIVSHANKSIFSLPRCESSI